MKFLNIGEGTLIKIDAITAVTFGTMERPFDPPVQNVEFFVGESSKGYVSFDPALIKWATDYLNAVGIDHPSKPA